MHDAQRAEGVERKHRRAAAAIRSGRVEPIAGRYYRDAGDRDPQPMTIIHEISIWPEGCTFAAQPRACHGVRAAIAARDPDSVGSGFCASSSAVNWGTDIGLLK